MLRNMFSNLFSSEPAYYDEYEPEWVVDSAASQTIRYPNLSTNYSSMPGTMPGMAPPQMRSTPGMIDPRVDHREPLLEPRILSARMAPAPRMEPRMEPRIIKESRSDRNQIHPVSSVRGQMPPALEYKILEFRVPLCCEGCEERVRKCLKKTRGVDDVQVDLHRHKVTVTGYALPADVLRALRKQFKRTEFWAREPLNMPLQQIEQMQKANKIEQRVDHSASRGGPGQRMDHSASRGGSGQRMDHSASRGGSGLGGR